MNLINKILSHKEFVERPPVLIDIGASGVIHSRWKPIAKYCICVAFDGDDREFGHDEIESNDYRKLYRFHSLVVDTSVSSTDFYLTKSPYCSSTLEPNNKVLNVWAFADKFTVEKQISVRSTSLESALAQINVSYVDWFKSDSQGIDLRLFKTLDERIRKNILAVEFEPGIIDAYKKEDKLWEILRFMEQENYWLSTGNIKGSQRISTKELDLVTTSPIMKKIYSFSLKESPGWIEMMYLHSFDTEKSFREYLLCWVIAILQSQYGFALKLSVEGKAKYNDTIFDEMISYSKKKIRLNVFNVNILSAVKEKILKSLKIV